MVPSIGSHQPLVAVLISDKKTRPFWSEPDIFPSIPKQSSLSCGTSIATWLPIVRCHCNACKGYTRVVSYGHTRAYRCFLNQWEPLYLGPRSWRDATESESTGRRQLGASEAKRLVQRGPGRLRTSGQPRRKWIQRPKEDPSLPSKEYLFGDYHKILTICSEQQYIKTVFPLAF